MIWTEKSEALCRADWAAAFPRIPYPGYQEASRRLMAAFPPGKPLPGQQGDREPGADDDTETETHWTERDA